MNRGRGRGGSLVFCCCCLKIIFCIPSHKLHRGEREGVPREPAIHVDNVQFQRTKLAEVGTRHARKRYLPIYSKGIVCASGVARPFGWLPPSPEAAPRQPPPRIAPTLLGTGQRGQQQQQQPESEEEEEEEEEQEQEEEMEVDLDGHEEPTPNWH